MTISLQLFYGTVDFVGYEGINYNGAIGCTDGSVPNTPYVILVAFGFKPVQTSNWSIDSTDGRFTITIPNNIIPPIDLGDINVEFNGTKAQFNYSFGINSSDPALEARVAALETSQAQQNLAILALNAANDEKTQQIAELQSKVANLENNQTLIIDVLFWACRNLSWALPQYPLVVQGGNPFVPSKLPEPVTCEYINPLPEQLEVTPPPEANGTGTPDSEPRRNFIPKWRRN